MTVTIDPQRRETAGHLQEHVVRVTGGTRGIWAAIGDAMAEHGAAIAIGHGTGRIINVSAVRALPQFSNGFKPTAPGGPGNDLEVTHDPPR